MSMTYVKLCAKKIGTFPLILHRVIMQTKVTTDGLPLYFGNGEVSTESVIANRL